MSLNRPRQTKTFQVTLGAPGTAQSLNANDDIPLNTKRITIKAPVTNVGQMYVGNDGNDDVSSTTGLTFEQGENFDWFVLYDGTYQNFLWFDGAQAGDTLQVVCYFD